MIYILYKRKKREQIAISLITDSTNYQLYAAELLLKKLHSIPEMTVSPYVRLGPSHED